MARSGLSEEMYQELESSTRPHDYETQPGPVPATHSAALLCSRRVLIPLSTNTAVVSALLPEMRGECRA